MKKSQILNKLDTIIALAKQHGATECEVSFASQQGLDLNVRLGKVDTLEFNNGNSVSITVYNNKRKASVSSTDSNDQSLKDLVVTACNMAKYTEVDEYAGIAVTADLATEIPDLDLDHPYDLPVDLAIEIATKCENAALEFDKDLNNSEGAAIASSSIFRAYANSNNFCAGFAKTQYSLSCIALSKKNGEMQRDGDYTVSHNFNNLKSPQEIGISAAKRTLRRLGSRQINTTKVPVIFEAPVAATLLSSFIAAISGSNLYRKTSFLVDAIDSKVFSNFINITESPHLLGAIGSAPFDAEGVATRSKEIITAGYLTSYLLDSYSARKLNRSTTGNCGGVFNININHNNEDLSLLLKKMGTGLLVTDLMGQGVNLVTGDYSKGIAGFWVEQGIIQYPVAEMTIAANLKDMFQGVIAIANDVDKRGNISTGSILIDKMTVAGL